MKSVTLFSVMVVALGISSKAIADFPHPPAHIDLYEGINNLTVPLSYEKSEIRDGISYTLPVDLFDVDNKSMQLPSYANGKRDTKTSEPYSKSKNNTANLIGFKAVTDDYGQLKSILEANKGTEIDSLVVVGPMNKDDFNAIWDCAVQT